MSIQEIDGKGKIMEYQKPKKSNQSDDFQESLIQNLKARNDGEQTACVMEEESAVISGNKISRQEEPLNVGMMGARQGIRVNPAVMTEALQTAEVRHMSYEESDNIEIAVVDGYTLKGKKMEEGAKVYVEAKYEDGRLEAYQIDITKIPEQTAHKIERFALETINSSL